MKQNGFLILTLALAVSLLSCGEQKNNKGTNVSTPSETKSTKEPTMYLAEVSFSDEMIETAFNNYQQIRMALVNSDPAEASVSAGNLAKNSSDKLQDLKSAATALANADDLEEQRELFSDVTAIVEPLFKASISEGTIYKQFCPMAFKGNGGYWISDVDEIRNPYYGEKMLKCGKVTETIEK